MSNDALRRRLPGRPSKENLRKQAKRRSKAESVTLGVAQKRLAADYGFKSWAALMRAIDDLSPHGPSPLSQAAARGDVRAVRALLAEGAGVDGRPGEWDTPLFLVCDSDAPAEARIEIAALLIETGAFTRRGCTKGATPLHAAARRGPAAMVELLLRNGALFWQGDDEGIRPYDYAERGAPIDRERILYLCKDGPRIEDPVFSSAVAAIQSGNAGELARLLDAHPRLLTERAIEPEIGPRGYFSDPALFWFIANNPTLIPQSPPNIVEITELMLVRGVKADDVAYALELVMTNGRMTPSLQTELVRVLTGVGARPNATSMLMSLGHQQTAPARWLVEHGVIGLDAAVGAGLGRVADLPALLARSSVEEKSGALAMAVINREEEAARLCLEAGADPNSFMPCHSHSTPLHQAALNGDVAIMELLVAHGARTDIADTMWRGTPLGWALHGKQEEAAAYLRRLQGGGAGAG